MEKYHILVPIDFSECATAALSAAASIARAKDKSEISLLHVDPGLVPFYDEQLGVLEPNRWYHHLRMSAAKRAAFVDLCMHEEVVYGDPVREILKKANDAAVDLIVMGTHGRSGLDRMIVGSVAEGVLRKAPCPVLCVKQPWRSNDFDANKASGTVTEPTVPNQAQPGV